MISLMVFLIHRTDGVRPVFVFLRKHGKLSSNPYEPPAADHVAKSETSAVTGRDKWAAGPFNFQFAMAIVQPAWLLPSEGRVSWFGASLRRGRDPDWMVNTLIATVAISAVLSLAVLIAVWSGRPIRYLLARCSAAMFAIWGGPWFSSMFRPKVLLLSWAAFRLPSSAQSPVFIVHPRSVINIYGVNRSS